MESQGGLYVSLKILIKKNGTKCPMGTDTHASSYSKQGHITPEQKSGKIFKLMLSLSVVAPNLVYKFQMICLRETFVIERTPNVIVW